MNPKVGLPGVALHQVRQAGKRRLREVQAELERRRRLISQIHDEIGPARLHKARMTSGLTISQAAKMLGRDRTHLGDLESGCATPTTHELLLLAEIYSVRLRWLQGGISTQGEVETLFGPLVAAGIALMTLAEREWILARLNARGRPPGQR